MGETLFCFVVRVEAREQIVVVADRGTRRRSLSTLDEKEKRGVNVRLLGPGV